ncbi:membrane protein [Devosia pacifica]|uniref:Membrane protein n=1 Tax=Devosia pacifica TaxID=1335967 RepID=A0A918SC44_9HYPH|nr:TIGR02186 family protein [Devosia pacifica]GHA31355.1 membrane protein [Devosia pacifica]
MNAWRLLVAVLGWTLFTAGVQAERLVSQLSDDLIEITSSYDGERITFFGNIEPDAGSEQPYVTGPYNVVIAVTGPSTDRAARRMSRQFGIWLNTEQVTYEDFPSFFKVLSSDALLDVTSATTLAVEGILPEAQPDISDEAGWWKSSIFGTELVRLMTERGFFELNEQGVQFLSNTAYTAEMSLSSDAVPGVYLAQTYVFKDGEIVARRAESFSVRKTGFERYLATSASNQPLFYGIACVVLAVFTGWLGGVIFKR